MTFLNFTFQDPSPLINYSSQWVEGTTGDPDFDRYSGGSFKRTTGAGATASLTFVATSITVSGAKRFNHGNYSVVLDGPPLLFDGNSPGNNIFQFPLWNAQNPSNTQHTVTITNVPTSQGANLDIDFISIGREIGPPGYTGPISNVTIDDESPFVMYNGSWSTSFSSTASNLSLHSTIEESSSFSVFFQGSSIELYGLYVNAPFQANVDNQFPKSLAGPDVDLPIQEQHPQTLLFLVDGLDENKTHVATLINSVNDPNRPLYFDYAIVRGSQKFFADTPSPNPNFAVPLPSSPSTTINATSPLHPMNTTSAPITVERTVAATRDIVGGVIGGVAGITFLAFIGFVLFRRSKYYHGTASRVTAYVYTDTPPSYGSNPEPRSTSSIPSPLVSSMTSPYSAAPSQQSHLITGLSAISHGSSQVISLPNIETIENPQHRYSSILRTYLLQEQDAARLVETMPSPPSYSK